MTSSPPVPTKTWGRRSAAPAIAQAWSLVLAVVAELAKAVAAERRYEQLRCRAFDMDDPAANTARRIYTEFYAEGWRTTQSTVQPSCTTKAYPRRESMKLYYQPGASSLLPHIVLVESELSFDAVKVDERTKVTEDGGDYHAVNPLGYVPALQLDDGGVLTEAASIAQYVADRVPEKRLAPPSGTLSRAKLNSWLNFISSELHTGCFCPLFDPEIPPAAKMIFRRRLDSRLAHVERHLVQDAHLAGDDFSIADVYLFVVSNWARSVKLDLSPYPRILAHRKRVAARPAVQLAMRKEKLVT
jgi:glutathione S-transferase